MRRYPKHPLYTALRFAGISMLRRLTYPAIDRRHNRGLSNDGRKILFLRHYHPQGDYHWDFFHWLAQQHPCLSARCELRRVGWQPQDPDAYALLVPLVQDPLKELYPRAYDQVSKVQATFDVAGIPVVNRIENLSNSRKSTALRLIGSCGLRCPRVIPVGSHAELVAAAAKLGLPFILRDDLRHGDIRIVVDQKSLDRLSDHDFTDQIACEFIDTSDDQGTFRKYRYVMIGDYGAPRHMIPSDRPVVRTDFRKHGEELQAEETVYLSGEDPNHDRLDAARRALALDVVAFDYSYCSDGRIVVWEPNPFAVFWDHNSEALRDHYRHQEPAIHRIYQCFARYYAERAGLADLLTEVEQKAQVIG